MAHIARVYGPYNFPRHKHSSLLMMSFYKKKDDRDIAFYVSELNISPVYLSRVVRQVSGRTVVDYINQMLLMEASFLLQTSQLSIAQIADRLHFADPASFSKFFSRMKDMTPRMYRERER